MSSVIWFLMQIFEVIEECNFRNVLKFDEDIWQLSLDKVMVDVSVKRINEELVGQGLNDKLKVKGEIIDIFGLSVKMQELLFMKKFVIEDFNRKF